MSTAEIDAGLLSTIEEARTMLSSFVMSVASKRAQELGFGWVPSPEAPSNFTELKLEFSLCVLHCRPMRVSSLYCEDTIYSSPLVNHAYRFWHDLTHLHLDRDFSIDHEIEVAEVQLAELRQAGLLPSSHAYRLFRADTYGQTYCMQSLDRFPKHQLQFALWVLQDGLEEAVAYEAAHG